MGTWKWGLETEDWVSSVGNQSERYWEKAFLCSTCRRSATPPLWVLGTSTPPPTIPGVTMRCIEDVSRSVTGPRTLLTWDGYRLGVYQRLGGVYDMSLEV